MQNRYAKILITITFFLSGYWANGQTDGSYRLPPKEIADMLLAKPTPSVSVNEKGDWMLLMEYNTYPSVEVLARAELRIAGLRINPANFAPSRQNYFNNLYLKNIASGKEYKISGLPSPLSGSDASWNPHDNKIAFTQINKDHVDLYVIDVVTQKAKKVNKEPLNVLTGGNYEWYDDNTLLYRITLKPSAAAPSKPLVPRGVTVQESIGKSIPRPTFEDLIKSPFDEQLFEFYFTAQLVKNTNGIESRISRPAIYSSILISPDKKYLLVKTLEKPFSYAVPADGFPSKVFITDMNGRVIKQLAVLPSEETAPSGNDNVQMIPRDFDWRQDEPATVTWCMALDSGFIKKNVDDHDVVNALSAPFSGVPAELFKTKMRFRGITWGNASLALVFEGLTGKQLIQVDRYNSSAGTLEKLYARNTTDAYSNPGNPVTERNAFGREVIKMIGNGNKLVMNNTSGASPKGDLPFLATFDLTEKKLNIEWRSDEGYFESVARVADFDKGIVITRRESEKEMPNYFLLNLKSKDRKQLTHFKNPYPQLDGVTKEKIHYKRADSVDLTGELYLPKNFNPKKGPPLPVFIWAYPAEYNSAADAAQVRGSEHHFTLINWASPVFYVTQGYAVLNNAEMPIVSIDNNKKPNDDFINQLTMNAEAAINKLVEMGVGDRDRMAVGGHSYGAFMTANLLAHTHLFKAGIARSGAYNRSLTPFGFQNEDRTYWDDPKLYYDMSPFSFANQIKTPLLLIHGDADDNTGTFPIQSERLFNAIKGFGGTVRYVSLPFEAHSYRGKENLLQMLYEQNVWLEKYVRSGSPVDPSK